jgi:hypothetical protein
MAAVAMLEIQACYEMGNYHPILMKFDTQSKKSMLSSKVTKAEMIDRFKMAAAAMLEILCML